MTWKKGDMTFIIRGWKGLQEYTGYHERTLRKWHYERSRLPIIKTHVYSKNSRWVVSPKIVELWFDLLGVPFKPEKD